MYHETQLLPVDQQPDPWAGRLQSRRRV